MPKSEITEGRGTLQAMLADQLAAASGRLKELQAECAEKEAGCKVARAALKAARLEVEHVERAIRGYSKEPVKRGPRKPKIVPVPSAPPAASA